MVLLTRRPHTPDSPSTLILLSLFFLLSPSIVASFPLPYTPAEHATIDSLRARGVPEKEIEARLLPRHALAHPGPHAGALSSAEADPTGPFAAIESLVVKKIVGDRPDVIGDVLALSESGDEQDDDWEGSDAGDTKFRAVAKRARRELGAWVGGLTGKVRRYMPELDGWMGRRDTGDGGLVVRGQMGKLKGTFFFDWAVGRRTGINSILRIVRRASGADRVLVFGV
jgi:hypothetical protein